MSLQNHMMTFGYVCFVYLLVRVQLLLMYLFLVFLQERVQAKNPPVFYLSKLKVYLDPSASKSSKVSTKPGSYTGLRNMTILEHWDLLREFNVLFVN